MQYIEDGRTIQCIADGRMVLSCCNANTVNFINKDGVEIFQIGKDKTGSCAIDRVYIKDNNTIAGGDSSATIIWTCFYFFSDKDHLTRL
jgi:protein involved in ribonucleotide reduction